MVTVMLRGFATNLEYARPHQFCFCVCLQEQIQQDSLEKLKAARQQLYETEQTANDTTQHLAKQREQIKRVNDNVSGAVLTRYASARSHSNS